MISLPFGNRRAAFAYFKLPPGDFTTYARTIEGLIRPKLRAGESLELVYGMGGSDLQVRLDLHNFRPIAPIQDALLAAEELSCSWVFTSPYQSGIPDESSSLRFTSHLRINRSIYSANGVHAERAVLARLEDLLAEARLRWSVFGELHGGIGWSDLVITGSFSDSAVGLLTLLLKIRELRIQSPTAAEERQYIIQKSLTVLGICAPNGVVDWERCKFSIGFQTFSRIRTTPGGFRQALKELLAAEVGEHSVFAHEGTYDLSVFPRPPGELPSLFDATAAINQITHGTDGAPKRGIEHTDTQLLFADPTKAIAELDTADGTGQLELDLQFELRPACNRRLLPTCLLASKVRADVARIEKMKSSSGKIVRVLPKSLTEALSNVLSILNHNAFDEISHFDSRPAISACLKGLENVLRNIDQVFNQLRHENGAREQNFLFEQLENLQVILRQWCDLSQRILAERAAGSFEEFFGVSDRLASFRGGIPKYLIISDQILHEFYMSIRGRRFPKMCHRFASVHEPIDEIKSVPHLGVVKIPIRNRFSLSRALPDLWHEVGIYIFHSKYRRGKKAFLRSLFKKFRLGRDAQDQEIRDVSLTVTFREMLRLNQERLRTSDNLEDVLTADLMLQTQKRLQENVKRQTAARMIADHDFSSRWNNDQVLSELAEMYADILVYFYGFRASTLDFAKNLACSRLELLSTANFPPKRLVQEYSRLLRRIWVVCDFQHRLQHKGSPPNRIGYSILGELDGIRETIRQEFLSKVRFADQWNSDGSFFSEAAELSSIRDANDFLGSYRFQEIYLPVLSELVSSILAKIERDGEPEPIASPQGISLLEQGHAVEMDSSEINDYYLHVHLKDFSTFLDSKRKEIDGPGVGFDDSPTDFLPFRSALARSALVAIHRSQILNHS